MSCFGGSIRPQSVWVPSHKGTTYKFIFGAVIVLEYQILNLRSFGDRLVRVSILVCKRLDMRPILEVQFVRKGIGSRHKRRDSKLIFGVVIVLEN